MKIKWLRRSLSDIKQIKDHIKSDSQYYADIFTQRIIECVELLHFSPEMGRIVPEINRKNVREVIFQNYRIIYRILNDEIQILTVIHGSRNLTKLNSDPRD